MMFNFLALCSTPRVNRGRFGLSEWEKKVSERKIGGVVLRGNPPPPGSEFGKRGRKKEETGIGRQRRAAFYGFCLWLESLKSHF